MPKSTINVSKFPVIIISCHLILVVLINCQTTLNMITTPPHIETYWGKMTSVPHRV